MTRATALLRLPVAWIGCVGGDGDGAGRDLLVVVVLRGGAGLAGCALLLLGLGGGALLGGQLALVADRDRLEVGAGDDVPLLGLCRLLLGRLRRCFSALGGFLGLVGAGGRVGLDLDDLGLGGGLLGGRLGLAGGLLGHRGLLGGRLFSLFGRGRGVSLGLGGLGLSALGLGGGLGGLLRRLLGLRGRLRLLGFLVGGHRLTSSGCGC